MPLDFTMDEPVWVFGYGSLIWRVDFDHVDVQPAWITGWQRRFWQGSVDHRGLPNAPGRVVTIVPQEGAICYGLAYRLPIDSIQTISKLDHRERGGYDRVSLPIATEAGTLEGLTYITVDAKGCDVIGLCLPGVDDGNGFSVLVCVDRKSSTRIHRQ